MGAGTKNKKKYSGWSFFLAIRIAKGLLSYIEGAATLVVGGLSPDVFGSLAIDKILVFKNKLLK